MPRIRCSRACVIRVMVAIGLSFLGYLVYQSRDAFLEAVAISSMPEIAGSIFLLLFANVFVSVLFAAMLGESDGETSRLRQTAGMFLLTQLGKYLPGRVWGVVAQVSTLRAAGSPGRVVAVNVELAVVVLFTTSGVGGALLLAHNYGVVIGLTALVAAFAMTASVVQRAWVLELLGRGLTRIPLLKKLAVSQDVRCPVARSGGAPVIALAGFWAMYLMGWWVHAGALPGVAELGTGLVVACLSLSYVVGLVSMLPAGLGAREATLLLLAPVSGVPFELMALLAITSRIALILVDGVGALIGFVIVRTAEESGDA